MHRGNHIKDFHINVNEKKNKMLLKVFSRGAMEQIKKLFLSSSCVTYSLKAPHINRCESVGVASSNALRHLQLLMRRALNELTHLCMYLLIL